ncbi:MAG: peptidylprolyl isomerase [Nitrososphaerota archaeon]
MPLQEGSLVYVDLTGWVKDTGEMIETTSEEEAKARGVYNAARRYEPRLVALGRGWVIKGLEEALLRSEVGAQGEVEIPPERAFGERDPSKLRLVPLRKIEGAEELRVGQQVEVDGRVAIVRAIGSGRVQLDFNHRYAGRSVVYRYKVVKVLEADEEKAKALFKYLSGAEQEPEVKLEEGVLTVHVPQALLGSSSLPFIKRAFVNEVQGHIPQLKLVRFVEEFSISPPQPPAAPQASAPAPS